jgi:hypothetical protein
MDGGVMRLGRVGNVMTEDPRVVQDPGFHEPTVSTTFGVSPKGEFRLEPLVELEDSKGKETHELLGSHDAGFKEGLEELETIRRVQGA